MKIIAIFIIILFAGCKKPEPPPKITYAQIDMTNYRAIALNRQNQLYDILEELYTLQYLVKISYPNAKASIVEKHLLYQEKLNMLIEEIEVMTRSPDKRMKR